MDFTLDPRLEVASRFLIQLPLCMARLQDDTRFPWIVLIPRRAGIRDFDDLPLGDLHALNVEILAAASAVRAVAAAFGRPAEKLNVAAIGNIVSQLHVHVVARRSDDAAWPAPVWGKGAPVPYGPEQVSSAVETARSVMATAQGPV